MTDAEKVQMVKAMTDETDSEIVSAYLMLAGEAIYHHADPFKRSDKNTVLEDYGGLHVRAAVYFLNKRGAEGESGHSENGINRAYESSDLPPSMLREITPIAGVAR